MIILNYAMTHDGFSIPFEHFLVPVSEPYDSSARNANIVNKFYDHMPYWESIVVKAHAKNHEQPIYFLIGAHPVHSRSALLALYAIEGLSNFEYFIIQNKDAQKLLPFVPTQSYTINNEKQRTDFDALTVHLGSMCAAYLRFAMRETVWEDYNVAACDWLLLMPTLAGIIDWIMIVEETKL